MKTFPHKALLFGAGMALASLPATAAFVLNNGDLILGFQASSGQGQFQNVFFNLGDPTAYRDGTGSLGVVGNIGGILDSVYSIYAEGELVTHWYDRADLRFGVIGNYSHLPTGFGAPGPVNGDPTATLYVSQPTLSIGAGALLSVGSSTELTNAGGRVTGLENVLGTFAGDPNDAVVLGNALPSQWENGWTGNNPASPTPSFGVFSNIEQTFGQSGDVTYVDIQRILATSTGANPAGTPLAGEYIASFGIDRNGNVSAVPEPSSTLLVAAAALASAVRRRRTDKA